MGADLDWDGGVDAFFEDLVEGGSGAHGRGGTPPAGEGVHKLLLAPDVADEVRDGELATAGTEAVVGGAVFRVGQDGRCSCF